jgi:gliding motility-associated-like protein
MKKCLILLFLFPIFITQTQAQDFFICTGGVRLSALGTLEKVQLPSCNSQLKANLNRTFADITFHPSGKLYGVIGSILYEIDTITGLDRQVVSLVAATGANSFNALTANAAGILYVGASNGTLCSYNPQTQLITNLGLIKVNNSVVSSAGDLTFYRGDLYIASITSLVKINLADPGNSSIYMNFGVSGGIYGIVSFVDCGQVSTFATTGDATGRVYKIDWDNRVLVLTCQTNKTIFGGASLYEFKASSVLLDTTRLVSYTCDKTQAGALQTRILRNRLGCDSVVMERRNYVKADTVLTINKTCDLSKIRNDTSRLLNFRGCDSLDIKITTYDADSVFSTRQMCRGDSLAFFGRWLKEAGNYYKNFPKLQGCDSVVALKLVIFDKPTTVRDTFVCQKNQVRKDTVMLRTVVGCDSFVVRNQLIAPRFNEKMALDKRICKGDVVVVGSNRFYTEGAFSVVLKNVFGCDSTINLSLRYLRSDSTVQIKETCDVTKLKDSIRIFTNQVGCDSSIIIRPKLIQNQNKITGLPNEVKLVIGDSIALTPQFNFTPNLVQWTPPNLVSCATCPSVFSRVYQPTTVRLFAKDVKDCSVQQDIKFLIDLNRRVYIPNAFSPNSDRNNDIFTIYGDNNLEAIVSLKIVNRWGDLVFIAENLKLGEGWDGTVNGQILSPDVYVFWAKLRFKDGEEVLYKGDVTLVK